MTKFTAHTCVLTTSFHILIPAGHIVWTGCKPKVKRNFKSGSFHFSFRNCQRLDKREIQSETEKTKELTEDVELQSNRVNENITPLFNYILSIISKT